MNVQEYLINVNEIAKSKVDVSTKHIIDSFGGDTIKIDDLTFYLGIKDNKQIIVKVHNHVSSEIGTIIFSTNTHSLPVLRTSVYIHLQSLQTICKFMSTLQNKEF